MRPLWLLGKEKAPVEPQSLSKTKGLFSSNRACFLPAQENTEALDKNQQFGFRERGRRAPVQPGGVCMVQADTACSHRAPWAGGWEVLERQGGSEQSGWAELRGGDVLPSWGSGAASSQCWVLPGAVPAVGAAPELRLRSRP